MSTAKKRTIKYVSLVASLILVVSYFSLLSPTSAYFYKTKETDTTLQFAMFDVEQNLFENKDKLKFDGATKLCDFDEKLFDRVAIEKTITLENVGEADARIIVDIAPTEKAKENGLRYYAEFITVEEPETDTPETVADGEEITETTTEEVTETTTASGIVKGALKSELESKFGIDASSSHESVEAKLNTHNAQFADSYVTIAAGEKATVRIIFWSEYDPAQNAAGGESIWQNAGEIANIEYPCNIRIIAVQDNDEAVRDALTEATEEPTVQQ